MILVTGDAGYIGSHTCVALVQAGHDVLIGDALHTVLCAAGFHLRWLLRAMVRLGLKALLLRPLFLALLAAILRANPLQRLYPATVSVLPFDFAAGSVR